MYRLQAPLDFDQPYSGTFWGFDIEPEGIIETDKDYIRRFFQRLYFKDVSPPPIRDDIKKLLVVMQGGAGDTLFATPGICALKEQKPEVEIHVCTWNIGLGIIRKNPHIDKQLFTITSELASHYPDFDEVIDFSRVVGYRPEGENHNAYDIYNAHFEELFGITVENKIPCMFLEDEEKIRARNVLIDNGVTATDKVIGIIDHSSNLTRSWPYEYSLELAYRLVDAGYKVVMLGSCGFLESRRYFTCPNCGKNQHLDVNSNFHVQTILKCPDCNEINMISGNNQTPGLIWTMGKTEIRQAASLITQCDLVIGPDSGLIHIAGALEVPFLGLYGPFHSDLRVRYMPTANIIQADMSCGPCYSHNYHVDFCPLGGTNAPCMWQITPDEVFEKTVNILQNNETYPVPSIQTIPAEIEKCPICEYENPRLIFRKKDIGYYQCISCRTVFADNAPANDATRYDGRWVELGEEHKVNIKDGIEKDLNYIEEFYGEDDDDTKLLELGVGDAYYLNELHEFGFNVYGIEASQDSVDYSVEKYGDYLKERLFCGDIAKFDEMNADIIVAKDFIEHFEDQHMLWKKMSDILNEQGIIILISPSSEIISEWNESAHVNTPQAGQHKMFLSRFGMEKLCEQYGLTPELYETLPNNRFCFVASKN